jgi:hypothetical protein
MPDFMGDEVALDGPFAAATNASQLNAFEWAPTIYQQASQATDIVFGTKNLYTVNKVIAEVNSSTGGTAAQKTELTAEAMANRAVIYMQWINYYGKPYLASTAATDPGFPIITTADATINNLSRNSVQEVYDFIVKDLTSAIPNLPVVAKIQTRMSRPAAEGLLGRVYLYMGRYSDAAAMLKSSLADIATGGVTRLYNYNVTLGPGGAWLSGSPTLPPNGPGINPNDLTESVLSKVWLNPYYNFPGIVITQQTAALYGASDLRLALYSANFYSGPPIQGGRLSKLGVQYSRCGLQLPDVYLMSAECKARLNDLAGAKTDLETLRENRMPAADAAVPASIAANQTALIKFIIDERTREFAAEGYRWFDMRRLSVDPLFQTGIVITHTIYHMATNTSTVYTLDQPNRLTMKIPPNILGANPSMQDNP